MILSGNDQVVSNRTTQELFGDHPSVAMVEIPEARHEVLQERDVFRNLFWQALTSIWQPIIQTGPCLVSNRRVYLLKPTATFSFQTVHVGTGWATCRDDGQIAD